MYPCPAHPKIDINQYNNNNNKKIIETRLQDTIGK